MKEGSSMNRREFVLATAGTLLGASAQAQEAPPAAVTGPKVRLGLIGCGGRGTWIAELFRQHGGYELVAAADYFQDRADAFGDKFGVPAGRRFTGLLGYRRLLEAGVDAVAIESPPFFHPEQAAAAVDAGAHVYLAKPVAVDVPGCAKIGDAARKATGAKRVFLVDFQARADSFFVEAAGRVQRGALGTMAFGESTYHAGCPFGHWFEPLAKNPGDAETRLRAWGLDRALSGDIVVEQNIHTLDMLSWMMGKPPVTATATGGLARSAKAGSCWDHFAGLLDYGDGVGVTFSSRQIEGHGTTPEGIRVRLFGSKGVLETEYGGTVMIRGDEFWRGGKSPGIYEAGARANIATFHKHIAEGIFDNPTAAPSVQSNLLSVMVRTAAYTGARVAWEDLVKSGEVLAADLGGLRA
jgi:myo-inositol 2-dehydrogenase / D-chiro-inositol 1-dehydrogenase